MDLYTNFYLQAALCIASFVPVYFLMKAGDKLTNELEDKLNSE